MAQYFNDTETSKIIDVSFHPVVQKAAEAKYKNTTPPCLPPDKKNIKFYGKRTNGYVDPIIDLADIQTAKDYFLNKTIRYPSNPNNIRDYALFVTGINCARRIGDLVQLTVLDLFNPDYTWREHFKVKEQKTKKKAVVAINPAVKDAITMLLSTFDSYSLDTHLFQSRKGVNQPITTRHAQKILKDMSRATGLDKKYNIGTHTMRKTWARQYYTNHPTGLVIIQKALNHSRPDITLGYIGITQNELDEAFNNTVL